MNLVNYLITVPPYLWEVVGRRWTMIFHFFFIFLGCRIKCAWLEWLSCRPWPAQKAYMSFINSDMAIRSLNFPRLKVECIQVCFPPYFAHQYTIRIMIMLPLYSVFTFDIISINIILTSTNFLQVKQSKASLFPPYVGPWEKLVQDPEPHSYYFVIWIILLRESWN